MGAKHGKHLLKTTRDMGKLLMIVLHLLTICGWQENLPPFEGLH